VVITETAYQVGVQAYFSPAPLSFCLKKGFDKLRFMFLWHRLDKEAGIGRG